MNIIIQIFCPNSIINIFEHGMKSQMVKYRLNPDMLYGGITINCFKL